MRLKMTVECFVFLPEQGNPETFKFVTLPRIGEGIALPGYGELFVVKSIDHMAREPENKVRPNVQMHLVTMT
jgi:hypothetical protein